MSKQTEARATDQLRPVAAETESFDRLLTVGQVAERLNVGERFVRRLIHERRIDVRHLGKHVRIKESAVEAFIEAGAVPAMPRARRRRAA
jgi:excisionase family DNA binding protein